MSTKAYELVSALERSVLLADIRGEASRSQASNIPADILSLDCCTKNVFLGTTNGLIIHYIIDEKRQGERITFKSHLQGKRMVAKKPIQFIKYIAAIDRMVLLVDSVVSVFDPTTFDITHSHEKLKNAHTFCVNEQRDRSNPFSQQVCVASKKRHIQLYSLTADKWIHIRDIGLPELPLIVCMDSTVVCVALQTKYVFVNTESAKLLELFPYDRETDTPFIKHVESGEFILGGPSDLGMFVTVSGMSQRPPIQLKTGTFSLAFSTPYMITLNDQFIAIHNITDQQQKQAIQFNRGVSLEELSDRILVTSSHEIYALVPVPWEIQVDALLADRKVTEALNLAQVSARTSGLSASQFNVALKYFIEGSVDTREVISLFPGFLSAESEFIRSRAPLHEYADINQITKGDLQRIEDCKAALVRFLESQHPRTNQKKDVHTTLMKVYSENRPDELLRLIERNYAGRRDDTVQSLQIYGRFHALAIFYNNSRETENALSIWSRLLNNEIEDESFESLGLPYFADVLSKMSDVTLLLSYAPVVLEKDAVIGSKIFTKRFDRGVEYEDKRLKPEAVIEYLVRFPQALTSYLEHLIHTSTKQKESFHNHLAMVYLDALLEAKLTDDNSTSFHTLRKKLQDFMKSSDKYSVSLILGRVEKDEWLLPEAAILHGKAGNDEAALHILVDRLQDYGSAKEYCINQSKSKKTGAERQKLFEILLHLFLDKSKKDERMRMPVIDLLNNPQATFNAAKVAELIPEDWSIALLSKFLLNSVRSSLHDGRQSKIARQLAFRDYYLANKDYLEIRGTRISLTDNRRCDVCHQLFKESSFVRLANGAIVHSSCSKSR